MWGAHDGMGWWMMFGFIWMVVFWGAIIAIAVWAVGRVSRGDGGGGGPRPAGQTGDSALEIAKKRYARGEITREQFEQLRQDLE